MPTSVARPWPPGRATVASVADSDDIVIAVIYRHEEPAPDADGAPITVISVHGDIDQDTGAYLERVLQRAVGTATGTICCDLTSTDFLGATGVRIFLGAAERARDAGRSFTLRGVHGIAEVVLDALGVDRSMIVD
jgi:anti-anti-sigma factor